MKRPVLLRTRAMVLCLFFPLATVPIIYGAKEFETIASWYGPGFQGRRTANGERFDENAMTAASKTLPFGTRVLVRNPKNDRQCVVTINDRGPYVPGRGIDLSRAAARKLRIGGVAPVICYVGGSSYSEIAHKEQHHNHEAIAEDEAPLAVPAPKVSTSSDLASHNGTTGTNALSVASSTQALVASLPPHQAELNNPAANGSAQLVRQDVVETTSQIPPVEHTISKMAEDNVPGTSDSYKVSELRKPGALLAAAMSTPNIYPASSQPPHEAVNKIARYPQGYIARPSMLPRGGFIVAQNAPTIPAIRVEQSPRTISAGTGRSHVVVHRGHYRHARYSYRTARQSDDMVDRLTYKIAHVCKKLFASL